MYGIMDIKITRQNVETALQAYMDSHEGRTPSMKAGAIKGVPELEGFTWQMLDARLGAGLVEDVPATTTLAKFKRQMGMEMFHGHEKIVNMIKASDVMDTVLAFIADKKVKPIINSVKIKHGPFKNDMNWNSLSDAITRSRGMIGAPEDVRFADIADAALTALEKSGVEVKGNGMDRGRVKMRIPKDLDIEAIKGTALKMLAEGLRYGAPKEEPPPEVDGDKLYMYIFTRVAHDQMEKIARDPEAEVMGYKVGDLNRAFKAKTVKGAEGYANGKTCNTLLQFEAAAELLPAGVVVKFDEPEESAAVAPPQPMPV